MTPEPDETPIPIGADDALTYATRMLASAVLGLAQLVIRTDPVLYHDLSIAIDALVQADAALKSRMV
jgi:hypothetical protein